MNMEIEQKYYVEDVSALRRAIEDLGGQALPVEQHRDTYYNHPCRDFAKTQEAFRIRRINGVPMITYKGTKLPGAIKARRELEWRLDPGDPDGSRTDQLLLALSFSPVATVHKQRWPYQLSADPWRGITVVIDDVQELGLFAEIERLIDDATGIPQARAQIAELAQFLGLDRAEPRSYLRMILEKNGGDSQPLDS